MKYLALITTAVALGCVVVGYALWRTSVSQDAPSAAPPAGRPIHHEPAQEKHSTRKPDDIGKVFSTLQEGDLIEFARKVQSGDIVLPPLRVDGTYGPRQPHPQDAVLRFHELLLTKLLEEETVLRDCEVDVFRNHVTLLISLSNDMHAAGGYRNLVAATLMRDLLVRALVVRAASPQTVDETFLDLARSLATRRTSGQDLLRCLQDELGEYFRLPVSDSFPADECHLLVAIYKGFGGKFRDAIDPTANLVDIFFNEDLSGPHNFREFDPAGSIGMIMVLQMDAEGALGLVEMRLALGSLPVERAVFDRQAGGIITALKDRRMFLMVGRPFDLEFFRDTALHARQEGYARMGIGQ